MAKKWARQRTPLEWFLCVVSKGRLRGKRTSCFRIAKTRKAYKAYRPSDRTHPELFAESPQQPYAMPMYHHRPRNYTDGENDPGFENAVRVLEDG